LRHTLLEGRCILVLDRKAGRRGVLLTLLVSGVAEVGTRRTPRVILCRAQDSHTRCNVIQLRERDGLGDALAFAAGIFLGGWFLGSFNVGGSISFVGLLDNEAGRAGDNLL